MLTMDMSCSTMSVLYWLTYSLHCSEEAGRKSQHDETAIVRPLPGPSSHQRGHGGPQQVALVLDVLDERVDEGGVGLGLCLSVGQEFDAVLAHVVIFLSSGEGRGLIRVGMKARDRRQVPCGGDLYRLWCLLLFGGVLGIKELGHVKKERRNGLSEIHLRDVVGRELLNDPEFGQCCLLSLAQPQSCTHHFRSLLFRKKMKKRGGS